MRDSGARTTVYPLSLSNHRSWSGSQRQNLLLRQLCAPGRYSGASRQSSLGCTKNSINESTGYTKVLIECRQKTSFIVKGVRRRHRRTDFLETIPLIVILSREFRAPPIFLQPALQTGRIRLWRGKAGAFSDQEPRFWPAAQSSLSPRKNICQRYPPELQKLSLRHSS
jgi:hypothetical protein